MQCGIQDQTSIISTSKLAPYEFESTVEMSSDDNVGKTQSFADKISVVKQVGIKVCEDSLGIGLGCVDGFLVVGISAKGRTEPSTETGKNFRVGERTPLENFSVGFYVLREDRGVGVLIGNYTISLVRTKTEKQEVISISIVISAQFSKTGINESSYNNNNITLRGGGLR
jgi:hypothetical protein